MRAMLNEEFVQGINVLSVRIQARTLTNPDGLLAINAD